MHSMAAKATRSVETRISEIQLERLGRQIAEEVACHLANMTGSEHIEDAYDRRCWDLATRQMTILIARGEYQMAARVLDAFINDRPGVLTMDSPLTSLPGVQGRVLSMLSDMGYVTIRSVAMEKPERLMKLPNINHKTVEALRLAIGRISARRQPPQSDKNPS